MLDRRRPRIGVILHDFSLGGTERIAIRLANAWASEGAHVTIFCGAAAGPLAPLISPAVEVVALSPIIRRGRGSCRRLGRALAHILPHHQVDTLFVPGNYHWRTLPPLMALGKARPRIVAQISAALRKPQRGSLRQVLFDWRMVRLLGKADALVAMAEAAQSQAREIIPGANVVTIPLPALDDDLPSPIPVPQGSPTITTVGRLVPEKGFAQLIEAFARCHSRDARLVIIGSGPEYANLRTLADKLGVAARIDLPGFVSDSRPWLDDARLFVLSSWFEGFGAVIVEALAAGRPVIATDCTPATALLSQVEGAGMVVPLMDVEAMADAIDQMLAATPPDPQALVALVGAYRIGPVARRYLTLFDSLIATGPHTHTHRHSASLTH